MTTDEHMERGGDEVDTVDPADQPQAPTDGEDAQTSPSIEGQAAEAERPVRRFYANLADL